MINLRLLKKAPIVFAIAVLMVPALMIHDKTQIASAENVDNETDIVISSLARERKISMAEASKRIEWQEKAADLDMRLRKLLPESDYGNLWIDSTSGKIMVGVVSGSSTKIASKKAIQDELGKFQLVDGVDIVDVQYSYETLENTSNSINKLYKLYIKSNQRPIQIGLKIDQNKVQVDIPEKSHLTPDHQKVIDLINQRYGNRVFFVTYIGIPTVDAGCNWWYCDSPLRGGVGIKGSGGSYSSINCTAGPVVQGQGTGNLYILTAGHCADYGSSWSSETYGYSNRYIGSITSSLYNGESPIDAMIVNTVNTNYSAVSGSILKRSGEAWSSVSGYNDTPPSYNETYDMATHSTNVVNERVCISPAITGGWSSEPNGGSCGEVEAVNVWFTACKPDGTNCVQTKAHRAGYCARSGDSGSPIFAGSNKVKGIHRGQSTVNQAGLVCSHYKYYTPITTILNGFSNKNQTISIY